MQVEHRYVVEVRQPTGEVIRGTVIDTSPGGYAVGTVIGVQVHTKSGEMRLDPNQQVVSVSAMINTMDQLAGLGGPIGPYSHGPSAGNVLRILSPGGQELPVQMDPGEISRLAQAIRSGDPATKQAAMSQLRDMRDRARAQVAGQLGGGLAPGASAAAAFGAGAGFFQPGQPAQPGQLGQPGYPSPAPPAGTFDSGGVLAARRSGLPRSSSCSTRASSVSPSTRRSGSRSSTDSDLRQATADPRTGLGTHSQPGRHCNGLAARSAGRCGSGAASGG